MLNMVRRVTTPIEASALSAPKGCWDPYFTSIALLTIATSAIPTCRMKLGKPRAQIRPTTRTLSPIRRKRSFRGTPGVKRKYQSTLTKDAA